MKKIGITGGIGSGKSTVCRIFESLGYKVYYADSRARELMTTNLNIINGVKTLFGEEAYLEDGSLNRKFIGRIVFGDQAMLMRLNGIVHPETGKDFEEWARDISVKYDKGFVLKEAAILYESGAYKGVDAVIDVYAPKSMRLRRVMERDTLSEADVLARMRRQWDDLRKIHLADFTIFNDELHSLNLQIKEAVQYFG